jgi:hypothetical protein
LMVLERRGELSLMGLDSQPAAPNLQPDRCKRRRTGPLAIARSRRLMTYLGAAPDVPSMP